MGIFNLFKKSEKQEKVVYKCANCFRPVSEQTSEINGKRLCSECQNKMYFINHFPENKVNTYSIGLISENQRWIFILFNGVNEVDDYTPFAELVKTVAANSNKGEWQGKIVPAGTTRFLVKNERIPLVYQFDGLFGTVIEYPEDVSLSEVLAHLKDVAGIEENKANNNQ